MPKLSKTGHIMNKLSGVRAIMKDINETLAKNKDRHFFDFSAGNPVIIPEITAMWTKYNQELLDNQTEYGQVISRYGSSKGYQPFIEALVNDFNKRFNLKLTSKNVLVTTGSMSLSFLAANAFGGLDDQGKVKHVILPVLPDYTGFGSIHLHSETLLGFKPKIIKDEKNHSFRYISNFEELEIDDSTGLVILSRPNNPTGNILKEEEVRHIVDLSKKFDVPVIIDSAYGVPYPALNFEDMNPIFDSNVIHVMSFSKAGLPGERLGVAIASVEIIEALEAFSTNFSIHSSRFGQALATKAIDSGELALLSSEKIRPFYKSKMESIKQTCHKYFDLDLPWYLHECQGGMFAWIWLENLPIKDVELYDLLKEAGVIVVPGSGFFPGLKEDWSHIHECIRLSLTASDEAIEKGIAIIGQTISKVYR